jgi:hypothetical protein
MRLASEFGPLWQFILAHPKLLILNARCFAPYIYMSSDHRSGGNVGIAPRDFQERWEGWKTCFRFSGLSTARHFHRLLSAQFDFAPFFSLSEVRRNR